MNDSFQYRYYENEKIFLANWIKSQVNGWTRRVYDKDLQGTWVVGDTSIVVLDEEASTFYIFKVFENQLKDISLRLVLKTLASNCL